MTQLPPIDAWHAASMRLTAFPVNPNAERARDWWTEFTGSEPEATTRKKLIRTDEGEFEGLALRFTFDAARLQWERHARVDLMDLPDSFPSIGPFPEAIGSFSELMQRWVEKCPPIKRLAFGAVLLQPVEDKVEGYRLLDKYLQSVDVDETAADFQYKINRPRRTTLGIDGLEINRLMQWSFMAWEMGIVARSGPSEASVGEHQGFACRLELDINTAAEFPSPLPQERAREIWGELVELAQGIAANGEQS